jgi:hypothetical protein
MVAMEGGGLQAPADSSSADACEVGGAWHTSLMQRNDRGSRGTWHFAQWCLPQAWDETVNKRNRFRCVSGNVALRSKLFRKIEYQHIPDFD